MSDTNASTRSVAFMGRTLFARHRTIAMAYLLAIAMFVITSLLNPGFGSASHVRFLLVSASFIGLVGLGQTFVILGGGVDLSIPYTLTTVAVLTASWANGHGDRLVWVIPAALGVAALIGLVNGIGVVAFGVSPIIMTMGMNVIAEGMLLVYTGGVQPPGAPNFINQLGAGRAGPIPIATLIWLALSVLAVLGLSLMTFGRRLYAIGTSRTVARLSGLNVNWTPLITYVISALAAGVAGLVLTGYTGEAYLGMGDPYLFPSVAAVAIGGAPLLGGGGHYIGTIAGALVLTVLAGLLPALNLPPGWTDVIYGVTIIVTVAVATSRRSGEAV